MTYKVFTKYGVAKKQVYNGQMFDSKFEAQYALELDLRKKAGEIIGWEAHKRIPLVVNGYQICDYYIDFVVYKDGETEYVETKGVPSEVWKLKWKLFEALYTAPGNTLTVVMQGKYNRPKLRRYKGI